MGGTAVDLSIVIVNWNGRDQVLACLESIRQAPSTLTREVFVVDNSSSDGSADLIAARSPQVQLIRNPANLGFARATNLGLEQARGRYVLLLNPDTRIVGDCLGSMVRFMDANPDAGAAACQLRNEDGTVQRSCRSFPTLGSLLLDALFLDALPPRKLTGRYELRDWDHASMRDVDQPSGAFLMVRAEVVRQVGPLDERFFVYYEDVDWCLRIKSAGWRIVFWPGAQAIHRAGGLTDAHYGDAVRLMHESKLKYFAKYGGRRAALLAHVISLAGIPPHLVAWAARYPIARGEVRRRLARMMRANAALLAQEVGLGHRPQADLG